MNSLMRRTSLLSLLLVSLLAIGKTYDLTPVGGRVYSGNPTGTPTAPVAGDATVDSSTAITVDIDEACICNTLTAQYKASASGTWLTAAGISTGATGYQFTGLSASTEYDFRFVADANSQTANSSTVTATTSGGGDTTPDAFSFTDQTGVSLSSTITSAAITVAGINSPATITVSGGTYDVNASGSFTSSSGTVNNGNTVRARHTSSGSNSTATNTVVTIGGVSDTFTSTTTAGGGGDPVEISGDTLTLNGSGFGTKATPGPLVYDNFSSGSNNTNIAGNAPTVENMAGSWVWDDFYNTPTPPRYSTTIARGSHTHAARMAFPGTSTSYYNNSLEIFYNRPNAGDEVYWSIWYRIDKTSTPYSRNHKPFIVYGSSGYNPASYYGWGNPDATPDDGGMRRAIQSASYNPPNDWGGLGIESLATSPRWFRLGNYMRQSSNGGANGAWIDDIHDPTGGSPVTNPSNENAIQTRGGSNDYWRQWHFGSYYDPPEFTSGGANNASANIYISSIYFDNTRQRVELANHATWASRTFSEIQPCSAWSDTQITCLFQQGLFADGATAHAHVVHADGSTSYVGSVTIPGP